MKIKLNFSKNKLYTKTKNKSMVTSNSYSLKNYSNYLKIRIQIQLFMYADANLNWFVSKKKRVGLQHLFKTLVISQ